MPVQYQRLFEVLEEIIQRYPDLKLQELDEDGDPVGYWSINDLLAAVERDFRNMTEAERKEFEKHRYFWGFTQDGRISVAVIQAGNGGAYTQFVQP